MPNFGSMVTELLVASVLFIKMPFNIILNGVYIFNRWTEKRGDECPLITRGHSQLLTAWCVFYRIITPHHLIIITPHHLIITPITSISSHGTDTKHG